MCLFVCFAVVSNRTQQQSNEFVVDDATLFVYLQNRRLLHYPSITNCYSIDSVRIVDEHKRAMPVFADYGEQEVFPFKNVGMFRHFKLLRNISCYTSKPHNNDCIFGGDRYVVLNGNDEGRVILCFKISCRLKTVFANECFVDSIVYQNPKDNVVNGDVVEYCHYWDDYVDNRTFWKEDYFLIDTVYSYRSLSLFEMRSYNLKKICNSDVIYKYGVW